MGGRTAVAAIYNRTVRKHMGEKLAWLFVWAVLALLVLGAIYLKLTTEDYSNYSVKVLNNYSYSTSELEAPRGVITDRNGTTLAYSETYYLLILEPKNLIKDGVYDITLDAIEKCVGIDRDRIDKVVNSDDANGNPIAEKGYYRFREEDGTTLLHVTEAQAAQFNELKAAVNVSNSNKKATAIKEMYGLDDDAWKEYKKEHAAFATYQIQGAYFEKQFQRKYPYDNLACKVVGYYSEGASTGIENHYSELLNGIAGKSYSYLNGDYNVTTQVVDETVGNTVVSTIDLNVQKMVEDIIAGYLKEFHPKNLAIMVVNPNNGEIIAMADDKTYNLNEPVRYPEGMTAEDFEKLSDEKKAEVIEEMYGVQRLFCTTSPYEPGSIFKPVTVASALEEASITPDDLFYCTGAIHIRGYNVRCHNRDGCGELTLMGTLDNSCNVSLMQIAFGMGAANFDTYFKRFGFGSKVGIDLPGEEGCGAVVFKDYTKETELELATSSFGQGFGVTMVQMAAAFSALVNGGYYYTPHVMREIISPAGNIIEKYDTTPKRTVISTITSEYMREALFSVVENGTGGLVKIEGYNIGGKTGTAERSPRGNDEWVASFISAAPIENPELVVYAVVDRTDDPETYASSASAQDLSKQVWSAILPYYNIHSNLSDYDYLIPEETSEPIDDRNEGSFIEDADGGSGSEESSEEAEGSESEDSDEGDEPSSEDTQETSPTETTVLPPDERPIEESPEAPVETPAESPAETPAETSAELPAVYPVDIQATVNTAVYPGFSFGPYDLTVVVTMSDGSVKKNPAGFFADPPTLVQGVNYVTVGYQNVATVIEVVVE